MTPALSTKVTKVVLTSPNTPVTNSKGTVYYSSDLTIWTDGSNDINDSSTPGVDGSFYVASVDVALTTTNLAVTLAADSNYSTVDFKLTGELRGYTVASADKCRVGVANNVPLSAKHPGTPWGHAGDIQWTLIHPTTKDKYPLNKTRVEIYGLSSSLPDFLKSPAVPVLFLRYMALPEPKGDWQHWVATTCMTDFWFRYDTTEGRPRFVTSYLGGSFKLTSWLKSMFTRARVNSFDQAGIVQIANCLKDGNPANTWTVSYPFGYLNKTQLVGEGQSNNPFFENDLAIRCIDQLDPRREPFGAHAFIVLGGNVLDASLGPHTGTETLTAYETNVIDQSPQVWTRWTETSQGVTSLDQTSTTTASALTASPSPALPDPHPAMEAVNRAMEKGLVAAAPDPAFSNADWRAIEPLLAARFSLRPRMHNMDVGAFGSEAVWLFVQDGTGIVSTLTVAVCGDHLSALRAMREHLGAYQRDLDDVFVRPTPADAKGQLNLESANISVWVRGDTFFVLDIDYAAPGLRARDISRAVDDFIAQSAVATPEQALAPVIAGVPERIGPIAAGGQFAIRLEASDVGFMDSHSVGFNALRLSKDLDTKTFNFLAQRPGEEEIILYFAHATTARTVSARVAVTVE
ncbi:hypothetical protein B0T24DRAFT_663350 [Lasiosphaeria ovina]|uniref:Uncharacterized protein n=1 Tax=Lasiosphaeria ovina TaxID=92902 RepID=A0AAE0KLY5_9PEZI|nr:hypothetical protein B0T24DRAFT_663350 [Lasiosphaeria ovina]